MAIQPDYARALANADKLISEATRAYPEIGRGGNSARVNRVVRQTIESVLKRVNYGRVDGNARVDVNGAFERLEKNPKDKDALRDVLVANITRNLRLFGVQTKAPPATLD